MDLGIKGKIALVTASSRGLGRACAEDLAREGCRVAICSRTSADIERTAEEITTLAGNEVVPFTADMSREDEINRLVKEVRGRLGDPEIVVVNAGGPPPGTFFSTALSDYLVAVELTLMSGVRLTHACLPAMQKQGWGRFIFITSVSVKQPSPAILLSNTMRAGLTGFMKTTATEVAPFGITMNAVCPGVHDTERIQEIARERARIESTTVEEALQKYVAPIPMQRMGLPDELSALVALLASERAGFITGASVQVDGGAYLGLL
jgi:3-oxoacyl-[acyl-carrier protein] reductase